MKLISFAVISLLAITVSAYPGSSTLPQSTTTQDIQQHQSTATQSAEQPQSTATQSEQQSDQDKAQGELKRLMRIYEKDANAFQQVNKIVVALSQEAKTLSRMAGKLYGRSQKTGINLKKKLELEKQYSDAKAALNELYEQRNEQKQLSAGPKKILDKSRANVQLLEENQRRIMDYNLRHKVQIGPSLNSFYNLNILKKQYKGILKRIAVLSIKKEEAESIVTQCNMVDDPQPEMIWDPLGSAVEARENDIQFLQFFSEAAKKILEEAGICVAS
ncbi:hypothetical protein BASA62_009548 [Batrachochytrium salamandrivorans]|nr:hypothetical protein BASA62_009548 [Batrachochytrium salamandrivorans]